MTQTEWTDTAILVAQWITDAEQHGDHAEAARLRALIWQAYGTITEEKE